MEKMNDFVLRGFCQKCELSITWDSFNKQKDPNSIFAYCPKSLSKGISVACEPVYFLSPKQIKIIERWWEKNYTVSDGDDLLVHDFRPYTNEEEAMWIDYERLLRYEPFLVAKILKESEGLD